MHQLIVLKKLRIGSWRLCFIHTGVVLPRKKAFPYRTLLHCNSTQFCPNQLFPTIGDGPYVVLCVHLLMYVIKAYISESLKFLVR